MFKMEIKTGGAAFRDPFTGEESDFDEEREVAKLLEHVKHEVHNGNRYGSIMDVNGNKVGTWKLD